MNTDRKEILGIGTSGISNLEKGNKKSQRTLRNRHEKIRIIRLWYPRSLVFKKSITRRELFTVSNVTGQIG